MSDGSFDVLVIAFAPRAHESPASALARLVGMPAFEAAALCRALPCAVLRDVSYARAEELAASLLLAGAEVRIAPRSDADAAPEPGRLTVPEVGFAAARGLLAGREAQVRPLGPATLRPPNVSEAEPALVHAPGTGASPALRVVPDAPPARPGMDTVRQVPEPVAAVPLARAATPALPDRETSWAVPLDQATRAAPLSASPMSFAADFGRGLSSELDRVRAPRPARPPSHQPPEPELLVASADASEPGVALDFRLSFPTQPANSPEPPGSASQHAPSRPPAAGVPADPRLPVGGELNLRTIVLLALLWLSVGLLLWSHDLL
jgi:hypothetical protein